MERRQLLTTYQVVSTFDDGSVGTLRWAILQANQDQTPDTIAFAIAGTGIQTIRLGATLPTLTSPILFDGTTQSGYSGSPLIELDGSRLPSSSDGLTLSAGASTIRGLAINGFSGAAIVLKNGDGNVVTGTYLGTDPTGQNARPNGVGILISGSSRNTIGGDVGLAGNLISGNSSNGIAISSGVLSSKNVIEGNLIGTDSTGLRPLPNRLNGIYLDHSSANTIGGTNGVAANVISGNGGSGIVIENGLGESTLNLIVGNKIGVSIVGSPGVGNTADGIALFGASGTTIGGLTPSSGNIVSGNLGHGLDLADGTTSTLIQGNFIGTGGGGTAPIANQGNGVFLVDSPSNTIGGTSLGAMNVIAANFGNGIDAEGGSDDLVIEGNAIGTDSSGTINLGNLANGIYLLSSRNIVGGLVFGSGNVIANNGTGSIGTGIQLGGDATQNSFLSNSIYGNHRLGINLGNGPTTNDDEDADLGANGLQNYPVLTAAQSDGLATTVLGSLNSTPNTKFLIQYFISPTADMSGFGPGKTMVGSLQVFTDDDGNATLSLPGLAPSMGGFLTATATDPEGNTSEFSNSVRIQTVADLNISVTGSTSRVDVGADVTYTVTVTNRSAVPAYAVQITNAIAGPVVIQSVSSIQGVTSFVFGNTVTASLGALSGGETATITIIVQAQAASEGSIVNTGTVASQSTDPDLTNNTSSITTTVRGSADLGVSIAREPNSASPRLGDVSTFTITIENEGPSTARNVDLTIPADASSHFVSISTSPDLVLGSDGSLTVDLGDVASGSIVSVTLVVQALATSGLVVTADVSTDDHDPDALNNTASLSEPVTPATDLSISMAIDRSPGYRGLGLVYTLVVRNDGPCDATDVALSQTLPEGATFISATSDDGTTVTADGTALMATINTLKSGAAATFTVEVRPTQNSADTISTSATVSSGLPELDPSNNSASLQTPIANASDLSVVVSSGPRSAVIGQVVTYTLTVTNHGPSDDPDVRFQELLPAGLSFVSASSTQGNQPTYSAGTLSAELGALGSGRSATITISVMPVLGPPGGLPIVASVEGSDTDLDLTNNEATTLLNVTSVDLSAELTTSRIQVQTGDYFTITATVRNLGGSRATGVMLSLPVGSLVQVVSTTTTNGTAGFHGNMLIASLGILDAGASATVTVQVRATAPGWLTSTLTASADEYNTDPGQGIASVTNEIRESAGVIGFASGALQVLQTAGYANFPVVRSWGSAGTVTVSYQTVAGSAVAGRDYLPTSGTLTFLPNQTMQFIQIPVLAAAHSRSDYTVNLVLSAATSGAVLGSQPTSVLTIVDPAPDTTPPQITDLSLSGPGKTITSLTFTFSEAIAADSAGDPNAFQLINPGRDGRIGTADDQRIAIYAPAYDPSRHTVTIYPVGALPANHYFGVQIVGSGPNAIHDVAGNLLDGSGTGLAGTTYAALFARGSNLNYKDSQGNSVNLRLGGPGFMDQIRDADGDGQSLVLQNVVQGRSTLSGTVRRGRTGSGSTQLGTIDGLGTFGQIRVKLASPAFKVRAYPFQQSSRHQPIVNHVVRARVRQVQPRHLLKHPKPRRPVNHARLIQHG
jgi:uncharacterized repeat protein (TIGR01451 family)